MNYFLLTTIVLTVALVVNVLVSRKMRSKVSELVIDHQNVKKLLNEEIERNCRLKQAFSDVVESASHYKDLYEQTLALYDSMKCEYDECVEDLTYAQAIITGDLSKLVD